MRDKGTGMWLCELLPFFDMTKEEMIEHWAEIAATVFAAEDRISKKWFPELRKARDLDPGEKKELADAYLRALGKEIVEHSGYEFEE